MNRGIWLKPWKFYNNQLRSKMAKPKKLQTKILKYYSFTELIEIN